MSSILSSFNFNLLEIIHLPIRGIIIFFLKSPRDNSDLLRNKLTPSRDKTNSYRAINEKIIER